MTLLYSYSLNISEFCHKKSPTPSANGLVKNTPIDEMQFPFLTPQTIHPFGNIFKDGVQTSSCGHNALFWQNNQL